jgi:hypothetical protein
VCAKENTKREKNARENIAGKTNAWKKEREKKRNNELKLKKIIHKTN